MFDQAHITMFLWSLIYAMLGVGLGVMGWVARRKKRKQAAA